MGLKNLEYAEYRAITTVSREGRIYEEFTTWRSDFIEQLAKNLPGGMGKNVFKGDTIQIKIEPLEPLERYEDDEANIS